MLEHGSDVVGVAQVASRDQLWKQLVDVMAACFGSA